MVVIILSDIDLLFITNGHGEDAIACRLASELHGKRIAALPLVGGGHALRHGPIEILGPAQDAPSGGWGLRRPEMLLADLRAGWLASLGACLTAARSANPLLAVAVGDLLPAAVAAVAGIPAVLVGCNKTDYYSGFGESYLAIEVAALRVWGTEVLPRDLRTHERLTRLGLRSTWAGNVMPDLVGPLPPPGRGVALLPGSRGDARANLPLMLDALRCAHVYPLEAPPTPGQEEGVTTGREEGVVIGRQVGVALAPGLEDLEESARKAGARVCTLEEVLSWAGVVVGTAGTASEVAAAHGRPVVAFSGPGPQYTPYFAARQKDLLGDALLLCSRDPVAIGTAIRDALGNPDLRARAAAAGRERVGEPGGARAIAAFLLARLESLRS